MNPNNSYSIHFQNLYNQNPEKRYIALQKIISLTTQPVDWVYMVWDDLLELTKKGDNHQRSIAVQIMSNLAKSDHNQKMLEDFGFLVAVTKDKNFITAKHSLNCLWKIGIVNEKFKRMVVLDMDKRFQECISERNYYLIRYNITVILRKMYDHLLEENLKLQSLSLIGLERENKFRKKYLSVWNDLANLKY
jgi:hypothetical protein